MKIYFAFQAVFCPYEKEESFKRIWWDLPENKEIAQKQEEKRWLKYCERRGDDPRSPKPSWWTEGKAAAQQRRETRQGGGKKGSERGGGGGKIWIILYLTTFRLLNYPKPHPLP